MVKKFIRNHLMGTTTLQPLWEEVNRLSLSGMNIGAEPDVSRSGEVWVMGYFAEQVSKGVPSIVFDVGAHVGRFTSEMVSRLRGEFQVYCFEPSRDAFEGLVRNLRGKKARVFNFGFGDCDGFATLYADSEGSPLGSLYNRRLEHAGIVTGWTENVRVRTLDNFCDDEGIRRIGFLKLDVEGHELKVMLGAKKLIDSDSIDMIQFEFGGCNVDSRTYFKDFFYLLHPRYEIFRILKDGLACIEAYEERYEAFLPTNYLAVRSKRVSPGLVEDRGTASE